MTFRMMPLASFLFVLVSIIASASDAGAYSGCYRPNGWHWTGAVLGYYGNGSPFSGIHGGGSIDVFVDDSFHAQAEVVGLPVHTAEQILLETLANFRAQTGSIINFRFRGHSSDDHCFNNAFERATLFIMATPPDEDFSDFDSCNGGDDGCTSTFGNANGDFLCSHLRFVGGSQAGHTLTPDGFRRGLLHELMHVLKFAHLSECDIDDDSVIESPFFSHRWLTNADIRYLWYDYGVLPSPMWWHRDSTPDSNYTFSVATRLYPGGESTSPVRTTNGDGRAHGVTYLEYTPSSSVTFARSMVYENNAWFGPQTVSSTRAFHTPGIAVQDLNFIGLVSWLTVLAQGDAWEQPTVNYTAAEQLVGENTWTSHPNFFLLNPNPFVSAEFDPISDLWLAAFLDSGLPSLTTASPSSQAWSAPSQMPALPAGQRLTCHGAVDVACSPIRNPAILANCMLTCLSQPRHDGATLNDIPGTVWVVPFEIDPMNDTVLWRTPFDTGLTSHFGPRVAANPLPNGTLHFVLLTSGLDEASESGYFATISDMWWGESAMFEIGPAPLPDSPFTLMPPDIGYHVFNGTPYLDYVYAAP